MATMGNEDLSTYFLLHYRGNLMSLLRKLKLMEEDSLSPFVCFHEKKKQAKQMQKSLEVMEEAFNKRMEAIDCQRRDLQTKQIQMKSHMEDSERTLKENEKTSTTALKKGHRERQRMLQKESEILRAKKELKALRNKYQKLCNTVQKYFIFTKYLEDVMKISEEIQEAIWRYKTLVRMEKDLLQSQQGHKEMSEQAKVLLDHYIEEKEAEILQYKNELKQHQLQLDQAQKDVFLWETCWANMQNTTAEKTMKLGMIKMAIFNLFQCLNTQLRTNLNVLPNDSHRQLEKVQQFIEEFADVSARSNRRTSRTTSRQLAP